MLYPLVVFAIAAILQIFAFGIGWPGWFGGGGYTPVGYWWLFLIAMVVSVVSIIRWGVRSKSFRNRERWVA